MTGVCALDDINLSVRKLLTSRVKLVDVYYRDCDTNKVAAKFVWISVPPNDFIQDKYTVPSPDNVWKCTMHHIADKDVLKNPYNYVLNINAKTWTEISEDKAWLSQQIKEIYDSNTFLTY